MKRLRTAYYIAVGIVLFLTHSSLLYSISPDYSAATWEKFQFYNIIYRDVSELLGISIIKGLAFAGGTIFLLEMIRISTLRTLYKILIPVCFGLLDGLAVWTYSNWFGDDTDLKNIFASYFYGVTAAGLIICGGLIMTTYKEIQEGKTSKQIENEIKHLVKKGVPYRTIKKQTGKSISQISKIVNNK